MEPTQPQQNSQQYPPQKRQLLTVPVAIIIGMALIAGAILLTQFNLIGDRTGTNPDQADNRQIEIEPVTDRDHIFGSPNAEVFLIEYSDTECPFCKQYHATVQRLMNEYGPDGRVAWVYRHFPLYQGSESAPPLHPNAGKQAEATECARELGGQDGFWKFINRLYEITPSNNQFDMRKLPEIATFAGLNVDAFNQCLESGKYAQKIADDYEAAIRAGAEGTPYTVLIKRETGEPLIINNGAVPYPNLKGIVDAFLAK